MIKVFQILAENRITKNSILLFIVLFHFTVSYSQTNPWENQSKENPWEKKNEQQKSQSIQNQKVDSVSLAINNDTTNTEIIDSTNYNKPQREITKSEKVENSSIYDKDSYYYLLDVKYKVKAEYKAPAAFIAPFITSGVFLIFAVPINLISIAIPSQRQKEYINTYKKDHPKASTKEMKTVKNAITSKRGVNTLGGTLSGLAAGVVAWVAIIWNF